MSKDTEVKDVHSLGADPEGDLQMAQGQALTLGLYFYQKLFTSCT